MGEHHRLRIGGGAGGELDEQEVVGSHLRHERIESAVRHVVAAREKIAEAVCGPGNLGADHDHLVQQRQGLAGKRVVDRGLSRAQEREEVDVEKSIGAEQHLHVRLSQAKCELGRLETGIDRHRHRPDRGGGVEQRHPGLVVTEQDADEIAAPYAERMQRLGGAAHGRELIAIAETCCRRHQRLGFAARCGALGHEIVQCPRRPAHVAPLKSID